MESDSDRSDVNSQHHNASVHLYMPVDRDSIDSAAGDGPWQNIVLEPARHSTHVEGASYVQLQYMPQRMHNHRWQVFNDSSDDSDTDEPLVDLSHDLLLTQSASSAQASGSIPASTCTDRYFHLTRVELGANDRQNNDSEFGQRVAGTDDV